MKVVGIKQLRKSNVNPKMILHLTQLFRKLSHTHAHSITELFLSPHVCVHHLSPIAADHRKSVSTCLLTSHLISASILGPVFGNKDQYLGLAIFLDTFRNDLHGMDVSVCRVCACVRLEAIDRLVSSQGPSFPTMLSSTGWPCL